MQAPDNNPSGDCAEGYEGVLCEDCASGYSRSGSGDSKCNRCPESSLNVFRLVSVITIAVIVISLMIRSTLIGARNTANISNVFVKILFNHLQLIMLTASFDFSWPDQVLTFFDSVRPVTSASD